MTLKLILYIGVTIVTIWALESINTNNLFKKNRYYQARIVYLLLSMSISYLVTNFLIDFFESTKLM